MKAAGKDQEDQNGKEFLEHTTLAILILVCIFVLVISICNLLSHTHGEGNLFPKAKKV